MTVSTSAKSWIRSGLSARLPWLALAVLAPLLWWGIGSSLIRRDVVAHVDGLTGTSAWALNWIRTTRTQNHGVWLDLTDPGDADLEIEPSGRSTNPDLACEFWLYVVKADNGFSPDLKALIAPETGKASAGWIPFEQGPGVTYVGQAPGHLRIKMPGRFATVFYGITNRGGEVTLKYRGETTKINTYAPSGSSGTAVIPATPASAPSADLHQRLPIYSISDLSLSWKAAEGSPIAILHPQVRFDLLGHLLFSRPVSLEPAADAAPAQDGRWTATGSNPTLRLRADLTMGARIFLLGTMALFAWLSLVWLAARALAAALPRILLSPITAIVAVVCIVCLVNIGLAWKAPLFVTPDGLDYIDAADGLATTHTFDRFPDYKAPGLSVMLAGVMLVSKDALDSFGWFEAALGMLSALMAYALVRARAARGWALGAALLVGIHPTLLTYECYLLREGPSAALVMAVALVLVKLTDRVRDGKGGWLLTLLLALLCAAGAYLRENLQLLLLFVPIILLVSPWKSPPLARAMRAALVMLVAGAMLLPRVLPLHQQYGSYGVVAPKAQCNRALAAWSNGLSDGNDTAFFSEEQWRSLEAAQAPGPITDYDFTNRLYASAGAAHRSGADHPIPGEPLHFANTEGESRRFVNEAIAREPLQAARDSAVAFVNQLGLWNIHANVAAASDEWYSLPLRGEKFQYSTNFVFDTNEQLWPVRLQTEKDRLAPLLARSRRTTEDLSASPLLRLMNEWFWTFRAVRPVFAVLFLVGLGLALRRKDFGLAGAAAIAFLSILGAAVVVATPTDRFGVPFIPIVVCMAVYALATLCNSRAATPAIR